MNIFSQYLTTVLKIDMRIVLLHFIFLVCGVLSAFAQTAPGKYWVKLSDKSGSTYSLDRPGEFLSPACIARRVDQGIGFDARDLPVNPLYVSEILAQGNLREHHRSKWFNAVTVELIDTSLTTATLDLIATLPFVLEIRKAETFVTTPLPEKDLCLPAMRSDAGEWDSTSYGPGFRQISMLQGHLLHRLGYTGRGVRIAVLDAGFARVDSLAAFAHLRMDGRIAGVRDFVQPGYPEVYAHSAHGTYVLGHMAGIIPDSLIGTAPDATYYLFRTEATGSEFRVEEDNWVAAAELADSLGVHLINSSLGYSRFDDPSMNYTYADMNGSTTRCTIAADIASEKGILVVNSAGNQGAGAWRYLTAPSDGHRVMAVGAVNADGQHAWFSSYGPSADGRVKPDVMAMGVQTVFAGLDGGIQTGNGTSFSAPIITGLAACLFEAYPEKSASELFDAIVASAHLAQTPNESMGYGLPDFFHAYRLLSVTTPVSKSPFQLKLYPNPANDHIRITGKFTGNENPMAEIRDIRGRTVGSVDGFAGPLPSGYFEGRIDVREYAPGVYFLILQAGTVIDVMRFQKINP